MKFKNRLKRIADILEKLGVGGIVLAIFQGNTSEVSLALATAFLFLSIIITLEN